MVYNRSSVFSKTLFTEVCQQDKHRPRILDPTWPTVAVRNVESLSSRRQLRRYVQI